MPLYSRSDKLSPRTLKGVILLSSITVVLHWRWDKVNWVALILIAGALTMTTALVRRSRGKPLRETLVVCLMLAITFVGACVAALFPGLGL